MRYLLLDATIVFPNQLFKSSPALSKKRKIFILQDPLFFSDTEYPAFFHKNKILLQKDDNFIFRISNDIIHSVKSIEGWCLFLEIASGPFNNKKTIYI